MSAATTDPLRPDLLDGLNEQQLEAVTTTDGPVLVVAGPGSGKTRVLTARIAYLINEYGVAPWNILALTFTNKAAREMKERIELLVGDRARWITTGTFHAFSARILRQFGGEIGIDDRFVIYDTSDQLGVVKTAMDALDINSKQFAPRSVLSAISSAKSHNIDADTYDRTTASYWEEVVARIFSAYQATLQRRNALDFDDLLAEGLRLLHDSEHARNQLRDRYHYVLVDEYQDTNHLQYLIVNALSEEHRNICVVGDPDQSIYGWRAADIRNILNFSSDYPDAVEVHLEQNYRSTPEILSAADGVIRENSARIDRRLRASRETGKSIVIRECLDEYSEARFIVEEISRIERETGYTGDDFAILYRTNAQSRTIEETFIRAGIPYQLIGGTRFYERREIKDAMALLRLVVNPDDTIAFERVIDAFPLGQGIGAKTLADLEQWSRDTGHGLGRALTSLSETGGPDIASRGTSLLLHVRDVLSELRELERTVKLTEFFDRALEETGYISLYSGGDPELADRWENLMQLRSTIAPFDELDQENKLMTFLEEAALVADADTLVEDHQRVTLITLHAVKGLEFKVVFITGVEDGLIPHQRSVGENPEMIEEERRLFYVGITRAEDILYITHAMQRSRYGYSELSMPSPFLEAIPHDVLGDIPTSAPRNQRRDRTTRTLQQPVDEPQFQTVEPGQRVFHSAFGDGTVESVSERAGDQEVVVVFKRHGTKRLMASLANLTVG